VSACPLASSEIKRNLVCLRLRLRETECCVRLEPPRWHGIAPSLAVKDLNHYFRNRLVQASIWGATGDERKVL
jgi:hypothetical protein